MGVLNNLKLLKLSLKIFNTFLNFNKETANCFLVQYVVASWKYIFFEQSFKR